MVCGPIEALLLIGVFSAAHALFNQHTATAVSTHDRRRYCRPPAHPHLTRKRTLTDSLLVMSHCANLAPLRPGRMSSIFSNDCWLLLATVMSYCWKFSNRDAAVADPTLPVPPRTTTRFFWGAASTLHFTVRTRCMHCDRIRVWSWSCVVCILPGWSVFGLGGWCVWQDEW